MGDSRGTFTLRHSILVHAPIERCFLLSTSIAIVRKELGMTPVDGRTTGLVSGGDTVRWEGRQLGFWNFHVSLIAAFDPPHFFQDRMLAGRFRSFEHDHRFDQTPDGVLLHDELRFTMPFGPLGWMVGRVVLVPHIRGLLRRRFLLLKRLAETDEWREYLTA
jgi:hypothetical protein